MKDFYEWCKRKYYQNGEENQTDPLPPPPLPSLPAAFVLYEDTDCFVVLIRNQRHLITKGENKK